MSRPGNYYSTQDSDDDGDSFSDELSPTDGYFNHGNMPMNVVYDPSQAAETEGKVLIPIPTASNPGGSSRTSLYSILPQSLPTHNYASLYQYNDGPLSPSTQSSVSPIVSRRGEAVLGDTRISIHGPPPEYSPVPESSTSSLTPHTPRAIIYSTFPDHRLEGGFLSNREPESMGDPVDEPNESTPLSTTPRIRSLHRQVLWKLIYVAFIITIIIALSATMFGAKVIKVSLSY
jgi:hypothetical protein